MLVAKRDAVVRHSAHQGKHAPGQTRVSLHTGSVELARRPKTLDTLLKKVKAQGYASVAVQRDAINALAVPIRSRHLVLGSLTLRYFKSAMTSREAIDQYLESLTVCATSIANDVREADSL